MGIVGHRSLIVGWLEVEPESFGFGCEPEGVVEGVGAVVGVTLMGQQLDLVATRRACLFEQSCEQESAYPVAAVGGGNEHGLDERGGPAVVDEVWHDGHAGVANDFVTQLGDVHREGAGGQHAVPGRVLPFGWVIRGRTDAGAVMVEPNDGQEIVVGCLPDRVGGSCLLHRSETVGQVGGLDPRRLKPPELVGTPR